jgi:opacity protein-like surface antigen
MSITLLLLSSTVHSQVKLGFQLGPNFTNSSGFRVDALYEIESKTYLFGGILAEFKISDMFYIQPEINFLPKGVTYKNKTGPYISSYMEFTLNYYEIPINILAKFNMDKFTPFLFAGPSLSFLSETNAIDDSGNEYDISEFYKKFDFSINFGGGVELSLSKSIDIFLMARYSLGLTNIVNKEFSSELGKINTQGTALAVGLKFSI